MSQSPPAADVGLEAWELLLRVHAALIPVFNEALESKAQLPLSWYDVLLELARAPEKRLRMSDLGDRVVLSRSQVSRIVDEMVRAGLTEKSSDPHDARSTLAALTPAGSEAFRRAAAIYLGVIDEHFSKHLAAAQLRAIVAGLRTVLQAHDSSGRAAT